jgi:kinetochore protein Spc7/SPC105
MTDIRFMDEITAPRRSVHPASRPAPREPSTIPLAEYVIAHDIDIPQMELYSHVSKDLQKWIEKSKEDYKEAEEEVQKVTPELFEEFRDTDEEGKAELLVCLVDLEELMLIRKSTAST